MTAEQLALITTDPQVMSGQAVLAGTRVPVSVILDCLAAGMTSQQILAEYPTISEAPRRGRLRRAVRPRGTRPPPPAAVKVKLDENVPRSVQTRLADSGHDVDTVSGEA